MRPFPQHTNEALATAIAAEVKTVHFPPRGCFTSYPFHIHPHLGCRLVRVHAFEQKHKEAERTMG